MSMPNVTLAIPEDLHEKMKKHSEIRWSEVVRKSISSKVEMLEVMDRIAKKSKLTEADVDKISHRIKREIYNDLNKR